jgi:hypothetical protein
MTLIPTLPVHVIQNSWADLPPKKWTGLSCF